MKDKETNGDNQRRERAARTAGYIRAAWSGWLAWTRWGAPPNVDEVAARLDRIQALADELAKCHRDVLDQMDLSTRLHHEIQAAKLALKPSH